MLNHVKISKSDIIQKLKLSCKMPEMIESIVSQQIIAETTRDFDITVTSEEIQKEGDNLRLAHKLVKAKDTWAWLKKYHLTLSELEELVRNNILFQKLANHLFSAHVEKFFYEHQLDYVTAATYEVIFDNRDLALEIFYALEEDEITFQEIARQYIPEPELRRAGGYKGLRYRRDFRPDIVAPVFAASPPQLLKPITTPKGVYLIWVEEIIRPQLDEQLREKIINELFTDWLKLQVERTEIITELEPDVTLQSQDEIWKQA